MLRVEQILTLSNMTTSEWIPVNGYKSLYEINKDGQIRSLHKKNYHIILKARVDRAGYLTVRLSRNNKSSTQYIHRLIASAFLPNPQNDAYVNHKDGNKQNNSLSNLEWCSHQSNIRHAYHAGLIKLRTKSVLDKCSGKEFISAKEAATYYGIKYGTLRNYLNGNIKKNPTCLEFKNAA